MKKTAIICTIIISLFFIFCLFTLYTNTKTEIATKNDYIDKLTAKYTTISPQFEFNMKNLGCSIDTSITVKDTAKKEYKLSELVQSNKMTFICRYSDDCCRECVDYIIHILTNQPDVFNLNNILFIGFNETNRVFKKQTKDLGLTKYRTYNCESLNIPAEKIKYPYYMIVDSLLNIRAVYFPNKSACHLKIDAENAKLMYNAINNK